MILYTDISTIPLHNWEQLNITGDWKWLVKKGFGMPNPTDIEDAYFNMCDQAAPITGAQSQIHKYKTLTDLKMQFLERYLDGDKSAINFVRMYDMQIENMMKGGLDNDIIKNRMLVEKAWGQPIIAKERTYLEFLKIRQIVEEMISKQKDYGEAG